MRIDAVVHVKFFSVNSVHELRYIYQTMFSERVNAICSGAIYMAQLVVVNPHLQIYNIYDITMNAFNEYTMYRMV